jgi:hypothetical protein
MAGETQAQLDAKVQQLIAGFLGGTSSPTSSTTTSKNITKLNAVSAKALLEKVAAANGYTGLITNADVNDFIKEFNKQQSKQIETVVKSTSSKVGTGASVDKIQQELQNTITTQYPSFFKPEEFASDYIWAKVNFKDEKTLGSKNIAVLQQAKQLVKDMFVIGKSDAEIAADAKLIASGKKTFAEYIVDLQKIAIKEHPYLTTRLQSDPTLTVAEVANPAVKILADAWEMDSAQIKWQDEPIINEWLASQSGDAPMNYATLKRMALNDKRSQYTEAMNNFARDVATGLGEAMGAF